MIGPPERPPRVRRWRAMMTTFDSGPARSEIGVTYNGTGTAPVACASVRPASPDRFSRPSGGPVAILPD